MGAQEAAVATARDALGGARPAIVAHEVWWAYGLDLLMPETVLLCAQRCSIIDQLRGRGTEVFCLSEHVAPEEAAAASAVDICTHPAAVEWCRRLGPLAVIATKPSERLASAVAEAGGRMLTPLDSLAAARRFENKVAFVEIAARAGLPVPRWQVLSPDDATPYAGLARDLGPRLVVQAPRGNAGQRTWIVEDEASLGRVREAEAGHPLRVAEMVEGLPATSTAVAAPAGGGGPAGVGVIEMCRQVTGVDWLTPMPLGSCGNVFGDPALAAHQTVAAGAATALATELAAAGYRGLFGVDFVVGQGGPVVIETNPRLVASLPLATQLEVEAGRVPMVLRHLLASAGVAGDVGKGGGDDLATLPPLRPAFQVIVRRLPTDAAQRPPMLSGVYRLRDGGPPVFRREGAQLTDLAADDEALVLVREPQEPVHGAKEFARVLVRGSRGESHPGLREAVAALRGA